MGQRLWIRGFSRLVLLIAVLAMALPSPLDPRPGHRRLQPDRRRRQPAHRGGLDPGLRRHRARPAGDARAAEPRGQEPVRHRALRGRAGDARGRAARHHRAGEPDDQPDRLRGQRLARRRGADRGRAAPAAARLFGGRGRAGRAAHHRRLPGGGALRGRGQSGDHPPVGEPGRPRLRDFRGAPDLGAADQLHRQPGVLRPAPAAGGADQPVELAELRLRQHLL